MIGFDGIGIEERRITSIVNDFLKEDHDYRITLKGGINRPDRKEKCKYIGNFGGIYTFVFRGGYKETFNLRDFATGDIKVEGLNL